MKAVCVLGDEEEIEERRIDAREVRTVNAGERGEREGESKRKLLDGETEGVVEDVRERFRFLGVGELLVLEGVRRGLGVGPESEGRRQSVLR